MAKLQSIGSDIDRAKAANAEMRDQKRSFLASLQGLADGDRGQDAAVAEPQQLAFTSLQRQSVEAELALADIVLRLAERVGSLYAAFGSINEPTRYERFIAFFSRRRAARRQALRLRGMALANQLTDVLLRSDEASTIASENRSLGIDLQNDCDRLSASLKQQRGQLNEAVENARHRLKEINATLATTQWRAGNTTDEERSKALLAERDNLSLTLEKAEVDYGAIRARLDGLDRGNELFGEFAALVGESASGNSLALKKLTCEMERAIQLHLAVSGSLEELIRKAGRAPNADHPYLAELLALHATHSISMDELERRKIEVDHVFSRRYAQEKGRVTGKAVQGVAQQTP